MTLTISSHQQVVVAPSPLGNRLRGAAWWLRNPGLRSEAPHGGDLAKLGAEAPQAGEATEEGFGGKD